MTEPNSAQVSGRWAQPEPDLTVGSSPEGLLGDVGTPLTVELRCLSVEAAEEVADRCRKAPHTGPHNHARREGSVVVITYINKMWPYDIAEMANELGLASGRGAAMVFEQL